MTIVERILNVSHKSLMCDHSQELREIALEVSSRQYRILHLEDENAELKRRMQDDMEYIRSLSERNQRYLDAVLKHKAENEHLKLCNTELENRIQDMKPKHNEDVNFYIKRKEVKP